MPADPATNTLSVAFSLKPAEAMKYLRSKGYTISWNWYDTWQEAHRKAFTVAKAMKMDVLQTIRDEVDKALDEGLTFQSFKKQLKPRLQAKGWWGRKEILGDDGTVREVQLGSPRRLATIYQTNMQTAYMAGRYKGQMAVAKQRPYWQYIAVLDKRTRLEHRALHGRVFRYDDPIWQTHYPPNGWNCFPPGTPVATPDGWMPIETILAGSRVIGGSGNIKTVTAIHKQPFRGNIVGVIDECGMKFAATPNHRVLTLRGWIRTDSLKIGDMLVQIAQPVIQNNPIIDIHNANAMAGYRQMPAPVQRETAVCPAFNGQSQPGQHDVDPIRREPSIIRDLVAALHQMAHQVVLRIRGTRPIVGMCLRTNHVAHTMGIPSLATHVMAAHRSALSQFFSHISHKFTVFFRADLPNVFALHGSPPVLSGESGGLIDFAGFVPEPLNTDGIRPLPRLKSKMSHQTNERMRLHLPPSRKVPVRKQLLKIESLEGFTSGAPLDVFDSLDSFSRYALTHCNLHRVVSLKKIYYSGNVHNLSVSGDESYCIPTCVVHNCRCRVRTLSESDIEREGLTPETSEGAIVHKTVVVGRGDDTREVKITGIKTTTGDGQPVTTWTDPGWDYNPGAAAWGLDLTKYDSDLRRQYLKEVREQISSRKSPPAQIPETGPSQFVPPGFEAFAGKNALPDT